MEVIKKNIISIICGIIALAAVIALFWPIGGYYADLQSRADARKSTFSSLNGLLTKQRTLPLIDPFSTESQPLGQFPTPAIINRGQIVTNEIAEESKNMLAAAETLRVHEPLVPEALPGADTMHATYFLRKYQQVMNFLSTDPAVRSQSLPVTILHAGMPPTEAEIQNALQQVKTNIEGSKTQYDAKGKAVNAEAVAAMVATAQADLPGDMRSDAATKNKMYIDPTAYRLEQNLTGLQPPGGEAMFNGQIQLWIMQDVFDSLAAANGDSTSVPTSIVKHLWRIDIPEAPFATGAKLALTPPPPGSDQSAAPGLTNDPLHPVKNPAVSATGRVSNGLYDVVPFNLRITVDEAQVPLVLDTLSRDKFITVLRTDVLPVDSGQALLSGYIYGDKPCVVLNLSCEELFFRDETRKLMPDSIQRMLGMTSPPPAAG